jgi:hypothetical protein
MSMPCGTSFAFTSAELRMRLISVLIFATTSGGVFAGTNMPSHGYMS